MGRGFCILLLVLSLCACGARSDLPESESVPSRTEWNQPEEASSGQMADDLTDKAAAADEPSAPGIPESEEAAQSPNGAVWHPDCTAGGGGPHGCPNGTGAGSRRCLAGKNGDCRARHGAF